MRCPKCGERVEIRRVRFIENIELLELRCIYCGYKESRAEIRKGKRGRVLLMILRQLLDSGVMNELLGERERYNFNKYLKRIEKRLEERGIEGIKISDKERDEVGNLLELKEELLRRYEEKLLKNESGKAILEEMKLLDTAIANARQQIVEGWKEKKVYIFEYDGKEHKIEE